MSAIVLSGRELAAQLRAQATTVGCELRSRGIAPALAVVTATADEAAAAYVRSIVRAAKRMEIDCAVHDLGPSATAADLRNRLIKLSLDPDIHGIVLQAPVPPGVSAVDVAAAIDPAKDVDGANPTSLGRLAAGSSAFAPATAEAVMVLLDHYGIPLSGRHVTVVGRSTVVGKPVAHLLLARHATVTICHSRTADLAAHTREADVIVVAAGQPGLVTGAHVKPGSCVIDVGTNSDGAGGIVGDVEAETVEAVAGALSPVPGGVGPVTATLLVEHAIRAASSAADGRS
jgi:methylenetetrahydrofolate dehydrogenase (NADP+)/methenyltetrahydrofolate cyclohydrolase